VRRTSEKAGLQIIAESPLGMGVSGSAMAYEEITCGTISMQECLVGHTLGRPRYSTRIDIVGDNQPKWLGAGWAESETAKIDGIVVDRPRFLHNVHPLSGASPRNSRCVRAGRNATNARRMARFGHERAGVTFTSCP
jgi:hypothetical protein